MTKKVSAATQGFLNEAQKLRLTPADAKKFAELIELARTHLKDADTVNEEGEVLACLETFLATAAQQPPSTG